MIQNKITFGIDREEIKHYHYIKISQSINDHHYFEVSLPHSVIEEPRAYTLQSAHQWEGSVVHIALENQNNFLGVVENVSFKKAQDSVGAEIIVTGRSKTVLLESGKKLHSWEDLTLQDMIREIIRANTQDQLQSDIKPEFTYSIPFQAQYLETDFQYIQRLAKQYNEWLFYDGEKLFFGKPQKEQERIKLMCDRDIYNFNISVQAKHNKLSAHTYNNDYDKIYKVQTQDKVEGLPRLGNEAVENAAKIYPTTSFEHDILNTGDEILLQMMLKKRQEASVADANYVTASSHNNKLKIGSIIEIDYQQELSPNDAAITGKDASKKNYHTTTIGTYIITEIKHEATNIAEYENHFKAIPAFVKTLPEPQVSMPEAFTQRAIVIDNADPKGQGRVRVQMLWQKTKNLRGPWVQVMTPDAGTSGEVATNRGFVFIPEVGDNVTLGFFHNDPNQPFVMGSVFNGQTGTGGGTNNDFRTIKDPEGLHLEFERGRNINLGDLKGNSINVDSENENINIHSNQTIRISAKNVIFDVSENVTFNIGGMLLFNVAKQAFFNVFQKMQVNTPYLQQLITGLFHTNASKALINSDNEIKLESPEMYVAGQKKLFLHSDEVATLNSKGTVKVDGTEGNKQSNTASTYTPANTEKIEAKSIAHFRPTKKFDYEYGFDYMQLDNKIYGGINFYKESKNFEKLAQEYQPMPIAFRPIDSKKDLVLQNYFCSWLSMYPQNDPAGKSTVTLNMLFEANEDMTKPFELEYNTEYFDITPTTFPPIQKTKEGKAVEVQNAITITCKKGFTGEYDKTKELNPAEIRVVIASDTEKDDHDQPIKHLAGKLLLKPNSDHDRRKTNVRFVKVLCKAEDLSTFQKNIKIEEIKAGLRNKCLSHFLIKPEFEADVKVLDLTSKSVTIDKFLQANPDKTSSLFGSDEKLVKDGDGFYEFIEKEYNKQFNSEGTDFTGIVILFANYIWLEKHTESSAETTAGYAGDKLALIFKNGFNQRTIGHEALHTLNLDHTFPNEKGKTTSKHIFNKQTTKNIMDYAKQNETGTDMKETYKWQWDVTAESTKWNLVRLDEWDNYQEDNQRLIKQKEADKKEELEKIKKDQAYRNSPNYFNTLDV